MSSAIEITANNLHSEKLKITKALDRSKINYDKELQSCSEVWVDKKKDTSFDGKLEYYDTQIQDTYIAINKIRNEDDTDDELEFKIEQLKKQYEEKVEELRQKYKLKIKKVDSKMDEKIKTKEKYIEYLKSMRAMIDKQRIAAAEPPLTKRAVSLKSDIERLEAELKVITPKCEQAEIMYREEQIDDAKMRQAKAIAEEDRLLDIAMKEQLDPDYN